MDSKNVAEQSFNGAPEVVDVLLHNRSPQRITLHYEGLLSVDPAISGEELVRQLNARRYSAYAGALESRTLRRFLSPMPWLITISLAASLGLFAYAFLDVVGRDVVHEHDAIKAALPHTGALKQERVEGYQAYVGTLRSAAVMASPAMDAAALPAQGGSLAAHGVQVLPSAALAEGGGALAAGTARAQKEDDNDRSIQHGSPQASVEFTHLQAISMAQKRSKDCSEAVLALQLCDTK